MNWYTTRPCPICSGSLHDDLYEPGVVVCMLCSRSFVMDGTTAVEVAPRALPLVPQRSVKTRGERVTAVAS